MTETPLQRRPWRWWLAVPIPCAVVAYLAVVIVPFFLFVPRLKIGPETTVLSTPLRPDGTVDYAAALNEEWSRGVTPENNAAELLARAFGPQAVPSEIRKAYFDLLGVPVQPDEGEYLTRFVDFLDGLEELDDERREFLVESWWPQGRPFTSGDIPEAAAWIEQSAVPLELIVRASRRERYYSPIVIHPAGATLFNSEEGFHWNRGRGEQLILSAQLLARRAKWRVGEGNLEGACEDVLACQRLARLVTQVPTWYFLSVGYAMEMHALSAMQHVVLSGELTPEQTRQYRERFESLPPQGDLLAAMDHSERFASLDAAAALYRGPAAFPPFPLPTMLSRRLDVNTLLRHINQEFDEYVETMRIDDVSARMERLEEWESDVHANANQAQVPLLLGLATGSRPVVTRQMGRLLMRALSPGARYSQIAADQAAMRIELARLGWGLAEFRADAGRFPESLEELVPDYLPELPLDLFTGGPLRYERRDGGFLLYSVGANGIDEGGRGLGESGDDLRFGLKPE